MSNYLLMALNETKQNDTDTTTKPLNSKEKAALGYVCGNLTHKTFSKLRFKKKKMSTTHRLLSVSRYNN